MADKETKEVKAETKPTVQLTHIEPLKVVKESTMEKRNETVAGIHEGKRPKFQPHAV